MTPLPDLASVVVPSRSGAHRLPTLLRALEQQTYPRWEAIVVLDGDVDDSAAVLERFTHLPLTVIVLPENRGRAAALNAGFAAAAGDVLIRADDDFEPRPDHIAAHAEAHRDGPVGAVGLPLNIAPDSAYMRAYGADADLRFRADARRLAPDQRWRLWGGNVSITRETYDRVGGYDTSYHGYGWEDVDFGYRLHRLGVPIVLVDGAEVPHHMAAVTTRIRVERAWASGRARAHFESLHGDASSGLGAPGPGAWNAAVRGLAAMRGRPAFRVGASATDAILPILPPAVGRKAVALLVEAASVAGFLSSQTDVAGAPDVVFMPGLASGGGAERYAVALASTLARGGGHTVLATTGPVTGESLSRHFGIPLDGVEIQTLRNPAPWMGRLPQALFDLAEDVTWSRQLRHLRPGLFVNGLYRSEIPGTGHRNIYVCHFPHRVVTRWTPPLRHAYMRVVAAARQVLLGSRDFRRTYADVVANSSFTAGHIRRRWGLESTVIPPACPSMAVSGVDKEPRIIAVGRFEQPRPGVPNKRLDVLVQTFAAMPDLHAAGWALDVVGACSPENEGYVATLVDLAGDAPVNFLTNASFDELRVRYSRATLYWHAQGFGEDASSLPETQEHFGISTVEAMSAGCVPVVIDSAGPREVVEPVAGIHRWTTTEELAAETRRLVGLPPGSLAALGADCRARAADFSPDAFATRIDQLLLGTVARAK